ncbi:MAG: chromate efflux transporter [Betaproteobacteria bacterium]
MSSAGSEPVSPDSAAPVASVSFSEALRFWLKLGFISFGGPAGQIAIMHAELVERRRWISEARFLHALNYCMLLPGPEAQQLATYIGWLMHRTWGGIVAGVLFVLPSLFILIGLSWVYVRFGDVPAVAGAFYGLKPAVTALVVHAAHRIGTRALKNRWMWGLAAASFLAITVLDTPFPAIVAAAALVGWWGARIWPQAFVPSGSHARGSAEVVADAPANTPAGCSEPARPSLRSFMRVLALGLGLWALGMAVLTLVFGWASSLPQMAWFFTKAALLTFGGAYAVLPYVFQGAVETHQWVSAAQMMDGLALSETTPGPLIMVVAFVGFVGGWTHEVLGPQAVFSGAALAATVVTVFTFLPSFIFILAGAPVVEATRGNLGFTAPLSAITAAVVGVILNLALFFGLQVLWPQGTLGSAMADQGVGTWPALWPAWQSLDAVALLMGLGAAVALFRYRASVVGVLAVCAGLGVALRAPGVA